MMMIIMITTTFLHDKLQRKFTFYDDDISSYLVSLSRRKQMKSKIRYSCAADNSFSNKTRTFDGYKHKSNQQPYV